MNEEDDDALDALLREWVQEGGLEQAPPSFVQHVMQAVEAEARPKWRYVPPIGRWGWIGLATVFIGAILIGILTAVPNAKPHTLPGQALLDNALNSTKSAFSSFNMPMILMLVALSLALLFALDRGLRSWLRRSE
jgi:hypothetical protein